VKAKLTHVRRDGSVRMVDVGRKRASARAASAQAIVRTNAQAHRALQAGSLRKGDALATARIAGVMAAKRASELIPLCHPLALTHVDVDIELRGRDTVAVTCSARCTGQTGVEMEAMVGACVAALTLYDMCKALDRGIVVESVKLLEKSGGRSGTYRA